MSLISSADGYFSRYIRQRDLIGDYAVCFTCGKMDVWQNMECGHYISRACFPLRYDEINCQTQCHYCNNELRGNIKAFEANLIDKYGYKAVAYLNKHKWTVNKKLKSYELLEIINKYK